MMPPKRSYPKNKFSQTNVVMDFGIIAFLALIFTVTTVHLKWLTLTAAITAALIGLGIYYAGGWQWLLPLLLFFGSSSILSSIGKNLKHRLRYEFAKSSKRDAAQVLANSAVSLIFVILQIIQPDTENYLLYICAIAAANADTWSTELGVLSASEPRLITDFSRVAKGRSGAVTVLGTVAAFSGSFFIAVSSLLFFHISYYNLLLLTVAAFAASFIDSFLGATIQAQYTDNKTAMITERKYDQQGKPNSLLSGFRWLNNDLVNLLAILCAPLFYLLFIKIHP